nr:hypothetical protein [Candidatus Sigynarchaeota archaeon]
MVSYTLQLETDTEVEIIKILCNEFETNPESFGIDKKEIYSKMPSVSKDEIDKAIESLEKLMYISVNNEEVWMKPAKIYPAFLSRIGNRMGNKKH